MRKLTLSLVILLIANAAHATDEDDQTAVREHSERYVEAIFNGDPAALNAMLHDKYEGRALPVGQRGEAADKAKAIVRWTNPNVRFMELTAVVESVQIFGDTAIESGNLHAKLPGETWGGIGYSRVWIRHGRVWRLVHEKF